MGKILGLGSEDMPTIGYAVSPAMTKKMISFVSRNCSKRSVQPKHALIESMQET